MSVMIDSGSFCGESFSRGAVIDHETPVEAQATRPSNSKNTTVILGV